MASKLEEFGYGVPLWILNSSGGGRFSMRRPSTADLCAQAIFLAVWAFRGRGAGGRNCAKRQGPRPQAKLDLGLMIELAKKLACLKAKQAPTPTIAESSSKDDGHKQNNVMPGPSRGESRSLP